jgi:hypothetical protein
MAQQTEQSVFELLKTVESDQEPNSAGTTGMLTDGVIIGVLVSYDQSGPAKVAFDAESADAPTSAQSIVPLTPIDVGRKVCLMFEQGERMRPIIMGFIQDTDDHRISGSDTSIVPTTLEAKVDGERVLIEGKQEIVLKCGKASITLTKAGKVLIRGTYLLSRSSGVNRIKGGSVQVN